MGSSEFVRADIGKLESFVQQSADAIREFNEIQKEFDRINSTLLREWQGAGSDAYKKVSDHAMEKVGTIKDILDTINDKVLKDIIESYNKLDRELAEKNRHAGDENGEG